MTNNNDDNAKLYLYTGKLVNCIAIIGWFLLLLDFFMVNLYTSDFGYFLDVFFFDFLIRAIILGTVKHFGTVLKNKARKIEMENMHYQVIPESDGTKVRAFNILNNVVINHKGSTMAYEAIAVGKTGVFVLTTCNKFGYISGKVDDTTWISHNGSAKGMENEMFPNPLNEIKFLQTFLKDYLTSFGIKVTVKGIVLMGNAQSFNCDSEKLVKTRDEALRLIVRKGGYEYSNDQVTKIFNILNACQGVTEPMPPEFHQPLADKEQFLQMENMLSETQKAQLGIDFQTLNSLDDEDETNNPIFRDAMDQMMGVLTQQQVDEFNRWSMEESMKSVTPFEMGGYEMNQGNSWNMDQPMNDFNNSFNDFNNSFDSFNNGSDSFNNGFDSFNNGLDSFNNGFDSYNNGFDSFNTGGGFDNFGMF